MHVRVIPFCITWSGLMWRYLIRYWLGSSYKYTVSIPIALASTICFFQFKTAFTNIIMASFLTWLGRLAFVGLMTTQCLIIFICLSREVWRQFQLVSHDHFLWPSSFCLDSSSTFQSAAPWLPVACLLYLTIKKSIFNPSKKISKDKS